MIVLIILSVIFLSMLKILLSTLNITELLPCGDSLSWLMNLNIHHQKIVECGRKCLVNFDVAKTQHVSFDCSDHYGAIGVLNGLVIAISNIVFQDHGMIFQ